MNYINKPRNEGGLGPINFPLMADVDRKIAGDYGVLVSGGNESGSCLRSTFIIDNKSVVRHLAINDFAGHLKADEILRMVKGIQEVDKYNPKSASVSGKNNIQTNHNSYDFPHDLGLFIFEIFLDFFIHKFNILQLQIALLRSQLIRALKGAVHQPMRLSTIS